MADVEILRERVRHVRRASEALQAAAVACCATSWATREAALSTRAQWRAWRDGVASAGGASGAGPAVLRVCMECEAVCFTAPHAGAAETWIAPPSWIRERFRSGWRGPALSHGLCARCAPRFEAALDRAPGDAGTGSGAVAGGTAPGADAVFVALAEVEAAAAAIAGASVGAARRAAVDRALARAAAQMADKTPSGALRALTDALQALLRLVRGAADGPADARAGAPRGRAGGDARFQPPLRRP